MEGAYQPFEDHTDDYPSLEIAIQVDIRSMGDGGGIALLFSQSQGDFAAPWGACIGGRLYTLPGEEVGRALKALDRPLGRSELRQMAGAES